MASLILVIASGAVMIGVLIVVFPFATLLFSSRIDTFASMNLFLGKTKDPLSIKNKAGMMLYSNGKINYQSVRK